MAEKQTAEVFHPGEFVKEEMEARGWGVERLAERSRLKRETVEELLDARRPVTAAVDYALSRAFGTGRGLWLGLQRAWESGRREDAEETDAA